MKIYCGNEKCTKRITGMNLCTLGEDERLDSCPYECAVDEIETDCSEEVTEEVK